MFCQVEKVEDEVSDTEVEDIFFLFYPSSLSISLFLPFCKKCLT